VLKRRLASPASKKGDFGKKDVKGGCHECTLFRDVLVLEFVNGFPHHGWKKHKLTLVLTGTTLILRPCNQEQGFERKKKEIRMKFLK